MNVRLDITLEESSDIMLTHNLMKVESQVKVQINRTGSTNFTCLQTITLQSFGILSSLARC